MLRVKIIFLLLFAGTCVSAQQLHIENYTPAKGLLDTRIIKIFQDSRGLIYFLTWEGISIFDGKRFENISEYNGESLGLVNDMVQWKGDTCYVFTFQKGIFKLVNSRLIKDSLFNKIYEPNRVIKIDNDHWLITSNTGLFEWNGKNCNPVFYRQTGKNEYGIDFAAYKNGYLVYLDNGGKTLQLLHLASKKITDSISGKKIYNITGGQANNIFINLNGKLLQLNTEAMQKGKLIPEPLYFASMVPDGFTIDNLFITEKKLWLYDDKKGYMLLNPETGENEIYDQQSGLKGSSNFIFTDKENNYWFVVFSKQLQKAYATRLKNIATKINPGITGLLNDENENVYAKNGQQLFLLQQHKIAATIKSKGSNSFFWQGKQWFYKTAETLQNINGDIINLHTATGAEQVLVNNSRITFDREGRLIISGTDLFIIEKNLDVHAVQLPYYTDNIAIDDNNNYWTFNRGGHIHSWSLKDNTIFRNKDSFKLRNISPRFSLQWNADTFCIGTRHNGIVWLSVKNGKLKELARLNTSNGLSNNFVTGLAKKNNNLLYAITGFGLDEIKITGSDTIIHSLSAANNLYLPFSYLMKNREGEIFAWANDSRLWAVNDHVFAKTGFVPAVWFSEITVNGGATDISTNTFSFNENNFRFSVTAPCFINAGSIRYNFLLENESSKWEQQSSENFYSINNLSPGKYTLNVTVNYPGKIYPDKKIAWSFIIRSPLWKRWWFIVLGILTVGFIFWRLVRAYYQRKLAAQKAESEKQQLVERERNRISRDIHDDLGSGLTKIAILSEVAKKQLPEPVKAKEQLEKISVSSRELVDSLQDIIWVLNPRNDTLESLAAYIREYALKYFEPLAVKMQFMYPEDFSKQPLSEEKRRNVFLTVKESLHNIAKHAWCNEVVISIKQSQHQFEISINDDGKGFDPDKARIFANGLKNMQNRIEQVGGIFSIQSEPGNGTLTVMTIPV